MPKRETIAQRGDKEFLYNGFSVMVPRSVLKVWEAQVDKQLEMLKVLRRHYAQPITEGILCTLEFGRVPGEPLSKTAEKMANPGVKKAVLELLKYEHYRDWHLSPIRDLFVRAATMAALDGDQGFFKGLGERLKKKPIPNKLLRNPLNKLLLDNWVGEGICFCWFSDKALQDFLQLTEETKPLLDTIRQARTRQLKLPKLRPSLVRSIERDGQDGKRILLRSSKPDLVPDRVEGLEPRAQETDSARTIRAIGARTPQKGR
jgi:hypothetical protein